MMSRQGLIKNNLRLRTQITYFVRRFFLQLNYLEIETPVRIPVPLPEANIDSYPSENRFLHTSPEQHMKRLVASGYKRIFQICHCFRKQERGKKHLPEFTMLEWYTAGFDYLAMMDQCEELIKFIAGKTGNKDRIPYHGRMINLKNKWNRISVAEAFNRYARISVESALSNGRFDEVMACEIEPNLGINSPVFLYDYPASCAALARLKSSDQSVAERFELYMGGIELCNGFSELTDAKEQKKRFEHELNLRKKSGKKVYPKPDIFLESLKKMPDCAGNALGLDRLVMLFADTTTIDYVVAFTPEEL